MPVVSGFFILYGVIASYPVLHHIISVEQHQRNTEGGSNDKGFGRNIEGRREDHAARPRGQIVDAPPAR